VAAEIIVCDTDVMIDYWNKKNQRHTFTVDLLENSLGLNNILLSAITKMELIVGAVNKGELNIINKNVHQFEVALIDDSITISAIQLLQEYTLSHGMALPDALIAATAMVLKVPLFTYNSKDFKFIKGLDLFEYQN
jgi:predicted nucleic acid-binding protein